jgi:hypothetical protein
MAASKEWLPNPSRRLWESKANAAKQWICSRAEIMRDSIRSNRLYTRLDGCLEHDVWDRFFNSKTSTTLTAMEKRRRKDTVRTCILLIAFWAVTYIGLVARARYISKADPTSWFFDAETAYKPSYSGIRQYQAEEFARDADSGDMKHSLKFNPIHKSDGFCIGIPTFTRTDSRLLRRTIGSFLDRLDPRERERIFVTTMIAQSDPNAHPAYSESWLHDVVDEVLTYNSTGGDPGMVAKMENDRALFPTKRLYDNKLLLKRCLELGTEYIIVLEDDVLAMNGWLHRTQRAIQEVETKNAELRDSKDCKNGIFTQIMLTESQSCISASFIVRASWVGASGLGPCTSRSLPFSSRIRTA